MPFFRFPFFYNPNYFNNRFNRYNSYVPVKNNTSTYSSVNFSSKQNDNKSYADEKMDCKSCDDNDDYFFELFGLKLYFDDILLICLIFFLYQEGVKDDELFLSLILLLLT